LSLLMDSVHNLSDEMALVLVFLAFLLPTVLSRTLLLSANMLNALGLLVMSAVLVWEAIVRLLHPIPIAGLVPVWIGLAAAVGNGGVACLLWEPGKHNATIRLAYVHNLGDVGISLVPVIAGLLVTLSEMRCLEIVGQSVGWVGWWWTQGAEPPGLSPFPVSPQRGCHRQPGCSRRLEQAIRGRKLHRHKRKKHSPGT
jgi:hypothetical protein